MSCHKGARFKFVFGHSFIGHSQILVRLFKLHENVLFLKRRERRIIDISNVNNSLDTKRRDHWYFDLLRNKLITKTSHDDARQLFDFLDFRVDT